MYCNVINHFIKWTLYAGIEIIRIIFYFYLAINKLVVNNCGTYSTHNEKDSKSYILYIYIACSCYFLISPPEIIILVVRDGSKENRTKDGLFF